MNKRENLLYISTILIQLYYVISMNINIAILLLYWILLILIVGNVRRIHIQKYPKISTFIRRSLYIWPLIIGCLLIPSNNLKFEVGYIFLYILSGISVGFLFIYPKLSDWKFILSREYIEYSTQPSSFNYLINVYTLLGAAIAEELFFRYYILNLSTSDQNNFFLIFNSVFLFWVFHYSTKWGSKFTKQDSLIQILFSCISVAMFLFYQSIIPSIIAHLTFNTPLIILNIRKHIFSKIKLKEEINSNETSNLSKKFNS